MQSLFTAVSPLMILQKMQEARLWAMFAVGFNLNGRLRMLRV